jgi:hypothetical protein
MKPEASKIARPERSQRKPQTNSLHRVPQRTSQSSTEHDYSVKHCATNLMKPEASKIARPERSRREQGTGFGH